MIEPKVSFPTDSLWKFIAVLGLVFAVGAGAFFLHQYGAYLNAQNSIELELIPLRSKATLTAEEKAKRDYLESLGGVHKKNSEAYTKFAGVVMGYSLIVMAGGFALWFWVVQRPTDKLLQLQLQEASRRKRTSLKERLRRDRP